MTVSRLHRADCHLYPSSAGTEVVGASLEWQKQRLKELENWRRELSPGAEVTPEVLASAVCDATRFVGDDPFVNPACARVATGKPTFNP